jgi:glutaminyl-peptide cyclotransferase
MRNWKLMLIIACLAIVGGAMLYKTFARKDTDYTSKFASFSFAPNLAIATGNKIPIEFNVLPGTKSVKMYWNDSLLNSWSNPKANYKIAIDTRFFQMGTYNLKLVAMQSDGNESEDDRGIQIVSDISPEPKVMKIVAEFPHNTKSYTQGLEWSNNILFEGTGLRGQSEVSQVELATGATKARMGLDATYFGEGISIMGNRLFQITWQEQRAFVYDKQTLRLLSDFEYTGEGWGLCNDGKQLIMSNGTETITFRDSSNFKVLRSINVYDNVGPRGMLNELEYINGKIYANVYQQNFILVIDPATGKVLEQIECDAVVAKGKLSGDVLNGIAFNASSKKLYITGKNWPKLFEVIVQ